MRIHPFVFDSAEIPPHVERILAALDAREDTFDRVDAADNEREATPTVKEAVHIGSAPAALFDDDGRLDVTDGVLVTEAPTGRHSLHVGTEAIDALGLDE